MLTVSHAAWVMMAQAAQSRKPGENMTEEMNGTPPGVGIRSMRRAEALYRAAECHAVAWLVVVICAATPVWLKAWAAVTLGIVAAIAAAHGADRMITIERLRRRLGNVASELSDAERREWKRGDVEDEHQRERIQIVTMWQSIADGEGDRVLSEAVRDLEAVLAMPSWSPQAREGIRACISKLKHGDHTAHLAEARAKLGIAERVAKAGGK